MVWAQKVQIFLAIVFAVMAGVLFLRDDLAPGLERAFPNRNYTLSAWISLTLAALNMRRCLVVWWREKTQEIEYREPIQRHPEKIAESEYNPELDFTRQDPSKPNA
jgi:hypothetical protein